MFGMSYLRRCIWDALSRTLHLGRIIWHELSETLYLRRQSYSPGQPQIGQHTLRRVVLAGKIAERVVAALKRRSPVVEFHVRLPSGVLDRLRQQVLPETHLRGIAALPSKVYPRKNR